MGDEAIANAIWELGRALRDDARRPSYIQTIPKRGYRLIAEVRPLRQPSSPPRRPQESSISGRPLAILATAVVLLLTAALIWYGQGATPSDTDPQEQLTIAAMPLQDLDGEEYFGQGLSLRVVARGCSAESRFKTRPHLLCGGPLNEIQKCSS